MTSSQASDLSPGSAAAKPAQRLLDKASELFSKHGIRAVGIDQILRGSGVAKASLYNTYGSKDALVTAYLEHLDRADRNRWLEATEGLSSPTDKVLAFFDLAAVAARKRDYRGCLYLNAATEYPGVELAAVVAHRRWVRRTISGLLGQVGAAHSREIARDIQLIYDGALAGSKAERSVAPITLGRRLAAEAIQRGM